MTDEQGNSLSVLRRNSLNYTNDHKDRLKLTYYLDVNFFKDHRDKIEVPDPLAVEDLMSSKLNNKRKLARLITQYRDIFFQYFGRHGHPSSGCYRE